MTNPIDKAQLRALAEAADAQPYNLHAVAEYCASISRIAAIPSQMIALLDEVEALRADAARWQAQAESALQLVKINQEGAELSRSLGLDEQSMKEKTP